MCYNFVFSIFTICLLAETKEQHSVYVMVVPAYIWYHQVLIKSKFLCEGYVEMFDVTVYNLNVLNSALYFMTCLLGECSFNWKYLVSELADMLSYRVTWLDY